MFWTSTYVSSPQVEALLNKEDFTLYELMDIDDIIQECKSQNRKLIDFITRPEVMKELVTLTTKEPPLELEERRRYKYPNVACELLTCDLPTVNEKLAGDEVLLSKLYSFIDTEEPLNPLLASFFSRTIGVLVTRVSDQNWYSYQFTCLQVLEFLKSRQRCVELLLYHLETSAIMDLILKLVTQVEGNEMRQNILNWLDSQELVQRLIKLLSPEVESSKHANASRLLCDMITEGREYKMNLTERSEPDPILQRLESIEMVKLLLETTLTGEKVESSIIGGIQVLLTLLSNGIKCSPGDTDRTSCTDDRVKEQCLRISNATIPFLEQFNRLLVEPPQKPPVNTTVGVIETPFGMTRLHVVKLFVALLSAENATINEKLVDLGTFRILLDLFFEYSWNNFLHTLVKSMLRVVIEWDCSSTNALIYEEIFIKCKLLERIMEAWEEDAEQKKEKISSGQSYMGHLIEIANDIVSQCRRNTVLDNYLKGNLPSETHVKWQAFVSEKLAQINITQLMMLGGPAEVYMSDSAGISDVYLYSQEVHAQQVYCNYQGQPRGDEYVSYAENDEKFIDGDEALHDTGVGQLNSIDFILNDEDLGKGEDMFSKVCFEKHKSLGEENGELNWDDGSDISFPVISKDDLFFNKKRHDSSSSDDADIEEDEDPFDMDIDSNEMSNNVVLPAANPWDSASVEPVEQTGWANFDNFESTLNIDNKTIDPEPLQAKFPEDVTQSVSNAMDNPSTISNISSSCPVVNNDSNGSGDQVKSAENDSISLAEMVSIRKDNVTIVDSVDIPDSNANSVKINRTSATEERSNDIKEIVENTVENVKPLGDQSAAAAVVKTISSKGDLTL